MAYLFEKTGLIRDRSRGYKELSYYIPKHSKSFMKACKTAHETIISLLPREKRQNITPQEMKQYVIQYVTLDEEAKREFIRSLIIPNITLPYNSGIEALGTHSLKELFELWKKGKNAEGLRDVENFGCERVFFDFFKDYELKTTNDLKFSTAHDFMNWRSKKRYSKHKGIVSASTIKKELDILKQLAKLAALQGWIHNGNLWGAVKVKVVVGKNKKVVEPLTIEEQKTLLKNLELNETYHDIALFLLITGIRLGELKAIKPESLKNNIISLHGDFVGNHKTTGKTSSANRNLPICPTIVKLFERGNIFQKTPNAFRLILGRYHKGVHPHRLRHTFAVNKLLAQTPLQMVSYQMGHAGTSITSDLYGKFEPKHFKAGFEETIKERKVLLKWLEEDYF
ncbi:MAG: tyrosine-type recombinase/integrase [Fibromonadaceae bacterium]|jgi:integrase|nr:tyrosine-type recombinase/integrase [Fibromonadaceae bacterium]